MSDPIYLDPKQSHEVRTEDLLSQMTIEEKAYQLSSVWVSLDKDSGEFAPLQAEMMASPEAMEEALRIGVGQICRPFGSRPIPPADGIKALNAFQKRIIGQSRLGIPVMAHEECLNGMVAETAVQFPNPLGLASTWDPDLTYRMAREIGSTLRSIGVHHGLAPVADVAFDGRWGRTEETYGEDPLLAGLLATAFVKGLQGAELQDGIIATLKHFAGYALSEGGRNFAPANVGRRFLEDMVFPPFEMAIREGGALGVMNAYQDIDSEPAATSHWLLTEVLRDRWGFEGIVVADYFAVSMLMSLQRTAANPAEAAAQTLNAGLDIELPAPACYPGGIPKAIELGLIDVETLNEAVCRILRLKFRMGLFEKPFADETVTTLRSQSQEDLAVEIAEKSIVLLKNEDCLPIQDSVDRIAVIGPNAEDVGALFGDYSFPTHVAASFPEYSNPYLAQNLLSGIRERFADKSVSFARGCKLVVPRDDGQAAGSMSADLSVTSAQISQSKDGFSKAVSQAKEADLAIVVVGDRSGIFRRGTVGEGTDATDLRLPGVQGELASAIVETGTPTVLVLNSGRPHAEPELFNRATAVLQIGFPGDGGAKALARVLAGDCSPSGKSVLTYPIHSGGTPRTYNQKHLTAGMPRQPGGDVLIPFGHGLSYTEFLYTNFSVGPSTFTAKDEITASVTIENTGRMSGAEIVQLYISDTIGSLARPVKELKAFQRLELAPGEKAQVKFTIAPDLLAFTDRNYERVIEPGTYLVAIGSSSEDIRSSETISYAGPKQTYGNDRHILPHTEIISE